MENYQRKPGVQKDCLLKQRTETRKHQKFILKGTVETLNICGYWCHVETFLVKKVKQQDSQNIFHLELLVI